MTGVKKKKKKNQTEWMCKSFCVEKPQAELYVSLVRNKPLKYLEYFRK